MYCGGLALGLCGATTFENKLLFDFTKPYNRCGHGRISLSGAQTSCAEQHTAATLEEVRKEADGLHSAPNVAAKHDWHSDDTDRVISEDKFKWDKGDYSKLDGVTDLHSVDRWV